MTQPAAQSASPWPHRLAVVLACATFPLVWIGGLVTSTDAGMAVPDWPTTYGFNPFLYPWQTWVLGPWDIFIEHGHRLFAATVGMVSICMCVVLWRCEPRRWVRWMGIGMLLGVIAQGVLGGLRVELNEVRLAQIHGCVGPLFFAACGALVAVTSPRWRHRQPARCHEGAGAMQRLAIITAVISFVQIVLGSQIRHLAPSLSPRSFQAAVFFHLAVAGVLAVHVAMVALRTLRRHRDERALWRPAFMLLALIGVQLVLGAATWVTQYGWPALVGQYAWAAGYVIRAGSFLQTTTATAHVAVGSLILALSVVIALRTLRLLHRPAREMPLQPLTTIGLAG